MTASQSIYDVFISYRWVSPEQEWVREDLFPALQAAGLRPLLDVEDFVPGRDLMLEMTRAGQSSRRALCVITPAYFDGNRMVGFEASAARRADPSGVESRLVPLLLVDAELPEWLRGLVPVDWTDPRTQAREWRKLLRVLGAPKDDASPPRSLSELGAGDQPPMQQTLQSPVTQIQDEVVHLALSSEGQFLGGVPALRRVSANVLDGGWNGHIEVHHAWLESVRQDIRDLLQQDGLSADQAKQLQRLRMQAHIAEQSITIVCLAAKLTFLSASNRESTWGVPMDTEEALGFINGLFVEADLAPRDTVSNVQCQLYVPDRVRDPVSIDVRLSESSATDMRQSWERELSRFDESRWEPWGWPDLVPLWHLRDAFIAMRLLPAIAFTIAGRIAQRAPRTIADVWEQVRQAYPADRRDCLVPYHWCLALRSDRSSKDLAWLVSPPPSRSELPSVLGWPH
jgi:hypothetical protein